LAGDRRIDARAAIISALEKTPKTPRELKAEVVAKGVPKSTYHYVLRQLIRRGEVSEAKYAYRGERLSDATIQELLGPVTRIKSASQKIELSKNLMYLADKPGIALQPNFLLTLEKCLRSRKPDVRSEALLALETTLRKLDDEGYVEDKKSREIIKEKFFKRLATMIRRDSDLDVRGRVIEVLAELGDPRAIDLLLYVIRRASDKDYSRLQNPLRRAIIPPPTGQSRNYLTRYHHHTILRTLSELASKGNKRATELADQIRRQS